MALPDNPDRDCPVCTKIAAVQKLADEHDFTYQEALDYIILTGLAYTHRAPQTAPEPGA